MLFLLGLFVGCVFGLSAASLFFDAKLSTVEPGSEGHPDFILFILREKN
jgi:hypothetical protein